MYSSKHQKL